MANKHIISHQGNENLNHNETFHSQQDGYNEKMDNSGHPCGGEDVGPLTHCRPQERGFVGSGQLLCQTGWWFCRRSDRATG